MSLDYFLSLALRFVIATKVISPLHDHCSLLWSPTSVMCKFNLHPIEETEAAFK